MNHYTQEHHAKIERQFINHAMKAKKTEARPCRCGGLTTITSYLEKFFVSCQNCLSSTPAVETPSLAILVWNSMIEAIDGATKKTVGNDIKRPRGKIPEDTKAWLKANPDDWKQAICKCGRWFTEMDHLAPYHNEQSSCSKCDKGAMHEAARKETE